MPEDYGNAFWNFISAVKDEPSLKAYFDNARNYTIAVGVGTGGVLVWEQATGVFAFGAAGFLIFVGVLLGLLNMLQSWVLFLRTFHTYFAFRHGERAWRGELKGFTLVMCMVLIPVAAWYLTKALLAVAMASLK